MRGLKLDLEHEGYEGMPVASYTDAWIEMRTSQERYQCRGSHPTRMRGLKYESEPNRFPRYGSHPTRMRGLKYMRDDIKVSRVRVASYADAWIEIEAEATASNRP